MQTESKTMKGKFTPLHPEKYKGNPSNIIYRSSWELKFMRDFDRAPAVIQWQSEERAIVYRNMVDNSMHRYFPDFVIQVKTKQGEIKTIMIEVKPYSQTIEPKKTPKKKQQTFINEARTWGKNKSKWLAAEAFCKKKGWKFVILTEHDLTGNNYWRKFL